MNLSPNIKILLEQPINIRFEKTATQMEKGAGWTIGPPQFMQG
jgi:hypothetical protein